MSEKWGPLTRLFHCSYLYIVPPKLVKTQFIDKTLSGKTNWQTDTPNAYKELFKDFWSGGIPPMYIIPLSAITDKEFQWKTGDTYILYLTEAGLFWPSWHKSQSEANQMYAKYGLSSVDTLPMEGQRVSEIHRDLSKLKMQYPNSSEDFARWAKTVAIPWPEKATEEKEKVKVPYTTEPIRITKKLQGEFAKLTRKGKQSEEFMKYDCYVQGYEFPIAVHASTELKALVIEVPGKGKDTATLTEEVKKIEKTLKIPYSWEESFFNLDYDMKRVSKIDLRMEFGSLKQPKKLPEKEKEKIQEKFNEKQDELQLQIQKIQEEMRREQERFEAELRKVVPETQPLPEKKATEVRGGKTEKPQKAEWVPATEAEKAKAGRYYESEKPQRAELVAGRQPEKAKLSKEKHLKEAKEIEIPKKAIHERLAKSPQIAQEEIEESEEEEKEVEKPIRSPELSPEEQEEEEVEEEEEPLKLKAVEEKQKEKNIVDAVEEDIKTPWYTKEQDRAIGRELRKYKSERCDEVTTKNKQCKKKTLTDHKCWIHGMKEDGLRLKPSSKNSAVHGLFAARDFKAGERICTYEGKIVSKKKFDSRPDWRNAFCLKLPKLHGDVTTKYLDAFDPCSCWGRFINSSQWAEDQSNCEIWEKKGGTSYAKHLFFIHAKRNISKGEELFVDYSPFI